MANIILDRWAVSQSGYNIPKIPRKASSDEILSMYTTFYHWLSWN